MLRMDTVAHRTIAAFLHALKEAQAMANASNVGAELDELLRHAKELLDILDEELLQVDRSTHAELLAEAATLRGKLEHLHVELRGGTAQ